MSRSGGPADARAAVVPAQRGDRCRPSPASDGSADAVVPRSRAATPRSPGLSKRRYGRAAQATRTRGTRRGIRGGRAPALRIEDQLRCSARVLAPGRPAAPLQVSEPQPVGRDPALPQQTRHQPIIGRRLRPGTQGTHQMLIQDSQRRNERPCRITTAGTPSTSRDRPGSIQRPPRLPGISRQCDPPGNRPPHVARSMLNRKSVGQWAGGSTRRSV